jgi:hydrogenase maturation protein HypF
MARLRGASLHITGIVQGVGFRPFIYGLAHRCGVDGWVRNTSAGVDIEIDGTQRQLSGFLAALRSELPPLARIDTLDVSFGPARGFAGFEIVHSEAVAGAFQPISPDVSTCLDCLAELRAPADRRYRYPFINCTNCGPRFTIISDIPYDRPNTTMAAFAMCPDCAAEYSDPLDRRFHAQPVACPNCGPRVWLESAGREGLKRLAEDDLAVEAARQLLGQGKIVAIKGLGGFHLACDATDPKAVAELRRRKLRIEKPFALMMPDIACVELHCLVGPAERELLESRPRPIVLLRRKPGSGVADEVAPHQGTLGVMLPYTPLHYLLFADPPSGRRPGSPAALVMTSGNLSEEPIVTANDEARQHLASLADAFLMHDRDIHTRCDDSVVRVINGEPGRSELRASRDDSRANRYFLRRSRGYAPDPVQLPFEVPALLAAGPELKNTFCLTRARYAFLSHHIGDLQNYETLRALEDGIAHFERLFRIRPEALVYDLHPDYLSTRYALARRDREGLPAFGVQHHHAHVAACMADNGLPGDGPVIGAAFDGTGFGDDGAIWGGEFLAADYAGFQRACHLEYFLLPGGDAAIRKPARTALALLWSLGMDWEDWLAPVAGLCFEERQALRIQLERGLNTVRTSSVGRLFDAVAALAGLRQEVNYEAQAAIELEAAADPDEVGEYPFEVRGELVRIRPALQALLADVRAGVGIPVISARFHNGIARMVEQGCREIRQKTGITEVALSGGVWQNMLLLRNALRLLRSAGFRVYLHRSVPANDGGVALGQAMVGAARF